MRRALHGRILYLCLLSFFSQSSLLAQNEIQSNTTSFVSANSNQSGSVTCDQFQNTASPQLKTVTGWSQPLLVTASGIAAGLGIAAATAAVLSTMPLGTLGLGVIAAGTLTGAGVGALTGHILNMSPSKAAFLGAGGGLLGSTLGVYLLSYSPAIAALSSAAATDTDLQRAMALSAQSMQKEVMNYATFAETHGLISAKDDGLCFFHALRAQGLNVAQRAIAVSEEVNLYMHDNINLIIDFISSEGDALAAAKEYVAKRIANPKEWADYIAVAMTAQYYGVAIQVHSYDASGNFQYSTTYNEGVGHTTYTVICLANKHFFFE
ncbi:MAG: hypothetical protein KA436_04615 [Oligoflexales bacterium]|nr:hypothetical protein [Oligoflexales bacterium]